MSTKQWVILTAAVYCASVPVILIPVLSRTADEQPATTSPKGLTGTDGNVPEQAAPATQLNRRATETKDGIKDGTIRTSPAGSIHSAIRQVESSGDDRAVGDGGLANGPAQFHRGAWQDGCEWGGVDWDYDAYVWSWPHCKQVMTWYWERYGAKTDCEKAVCFNRLKTFLYWKRVQGAGNDEAGITRLERQD